jgi:hypothetical protein
LNIEIEFEDEVTANISYLSFNEKSIICEEGKLNIWFVMIEDIGSIFNAPELPSILNGLKFRSSS